MRALCHAFFGTPLYKELGSEKTLVMLAERGFLVIDTIPFAMPYGGKRGRRAYKKLVAMTCASYLREKLDECALKWNNQVKIAFAFNVNARTLIEHLGGTLRLGGVTHRIAEEMIAASGAGYPDGRRLTEAYDLHANVR